MRINEYLWSKMLRACAESRVAYYKVKYMLEGTASSLEVRVIVVVIVWTIICLQIYNFESNTNSD